MIVVADASPLGYLVLIEVSEVLPQLYGGVFVPPAVITELRQELIHGRIVKFGIRWDF